MKAFKRVIIVGLGIIIISINGPQILAQASKQNSLRTSISVDIKLENGVYYAGEAILGKVIINNRSPATLPGSFEVKLYHEDDLRFSTIVYIKTLFQGANKIKFKNFGIPQLKNDNSSLGRWTIIICQMNRSQDSAIAEFIIKEMP